MCWNLCVTSTTPLIRRLPVAAAVAIGASIVLTITISLLGPSAMVPALPGPAWQPPYFLSLHPAPHLVVAMGAAAIVLGALGLLLGLRGLPGKPSTWVMIGCVAAGLLAFLPPSGSGDHLNYAAYGRMVVLGVNPYTHGATALPGDPIADAVEAPWREEPSVYGPVATAVQALASWIGGDSVRLTVFVLALVNAAAFIATALLIDRFTRDDPAVRLRAALLWTANPLLLYHLVAGMHIDTLAIACMVAAVLSRTRLVRAGLLLGLGVAVKLNAGLVALGPAWELRRRPARLAVMAGTAVGVVVLGYALTGPSALAPVSRTSKSVSFASYWKLVQGWLQSLFGSGAYRAELQVASVAVIVLLAYLLFRLVAATSSGGAPGFLGVGREGVSAPVVAVVVVTAYVFATPYILPWYDGMAFGLLALVAASALDRFLMVHLLVLSLGYLPARVAGQPEDLVWLTTVVRSRMVPWALLALTIALGWWAWRAAARARRPRASAGRPR